MLVKPGPRQITRARMLFCVSLALIAVSPLQSSPDLHLLAPSADGFAVALTFFVPSAEAAESLAARIAHADEAALLNEIVEVAVETGNDLRQALASATLAVAVEVVDDVVSGHWHVLYRRGP